jgi:hypothetical protein
MSPPVSTLIILDISPEIKAKRCILEIVDTVQSNNPQIFGVKPAFDGKKNISHSSPVVKRGFSPTDLRGPSMSIPSLFAWLHKWNLSIYSQ